MKNFISTPIGIICCVWAVVIVVAGIWVVWCLVKAPVIKDDEL